MPSTSQIVKNLAEEIRGKEVKKNWPAEFCKRHKLKLKSAYLRNLNNLRVSAKRVPIFILFFTLLAQVIEKYHITADNIYNFDEKGFLIGIARTMKRIISLETYKSSRVTKNKQDRNREFISLLACSNNAIGLLWLQKVFERFTKPSSSKVRRLLIVNGYFSHHKIIIMIFSLYTIHRLQPLNVGLFQPLSTAYSVELDNLMNQSIGMTSMSKRFFYSLFKIA
ncbi:hypothetical protein BDZ45DRAFT_716637 [Acephala macrosclerotiorum]|nr:hypothetical protein BDZ45DRAFT_716637 [Acephala macrosclerotiorum]